MGPEQLASSCSRRSLQPSPWKPRPRRWQGPKLHPSAGSAQPTHGVGEARPADGNSAAAMAADVEGDVYVLVEHPFEYTGKDGRRVAIQPNERYRLLRRSTEHRGHACSVAGSWVCPRPLAHSDSENVYEAIQDVRGPPQEHRPEQGKPGEQGPFETPPQWLQGPPLGGKAQAGHLDWSPPPLPGLWPLGGKSFSPSL
uniref:Rho GTPase-activating protein 27-like n=1 Tax=Camelus bactrianus TaxID=9837 RepID=A0A9W3HL90_CAMBA|nr:rho GTPase-activating protein 27-like [Camelus bactrianus]